MDTVEITALMLYYGGKNLAEEAIESFLRQTYPHKRLLIVNTHPDGVHFEQDYPNIEVHNIIPDTFRNLNEKYNYAFAQVKTNWWCPWDSDDIWMPWHFENLVAGIPAARRNSDPTPMKVGLRHCYFSEDNAIDRVGWNMWANCIYETFDENGDRHALCDDTIAQNCDGQILFLQWNRMWLKSPKSYIFRWSQAPHGSAYLGEKGLEYQAQCRAKMYAIRDSRSFRPHWDRDYVQDVKEFDDRLKEGDRKIVQGIEDEVMRDIRSKVS